MGHPFLLPLGKELLKRVAQTLQSDNAYILRDSNIVFVCGGPENEPSMRQRFLVYARTNLTHLRTFLAETADSDYVTSEESKLYDVGEFEELIGEIADCLIIFPESPGSFAELGYFSRSEELCKRILVVNNADLQSKDSFIRRGPIHRIDAVSKFKNEIQIAYGDEANFDLIKERLESRIVGKNRKRFEPKNYKDLTTRDTFFVLFEIVRLFEVISLEGIEYAFKSLFTHSNPSKLRQLLSILIAADFVRRGGKDQQYFCINRSIGPFMELDRFDEVKFRLELTDLYNQHFFDIAEIVRGLSNAP